MLNSTTVRAWSTTCYGRDLGQKLPFFSEDQLQNKDEVKKTLKQDFAQGYRQLTCASQVRPLVLSPQLKLPRHACELVVPVCTKAAFLSETCPAALVFGILANPESSVDVYCSAVLQSDLYYF